MATLSLRRNLGPLTNDQIDDNFVNLNSDIQTRVLTTDTVSTNTANKVVLRDGSGGFSAGDVTLTGINNTGNTTLGDSSSDTITLNGTVGAGVVISGSTSSDALRITQNGTGNALVVEDSASDTTPFVIDTLGVVFSYSPVRCHTIADNAYSHTFSWSKGRGTGNSPTIVSSGDQLCVLAFRGFDGVDYISSASIQTFVDGIPGVNDMPGRLVFSTTADGASTPTERMRIGSNGVVAIGSTITSGGGSGCSIRFANDLTGGTSAVSILGTPQIKSDVTNSAQIYATAPTTQATTFTLSSLAHYHASQGTFGAGSTITNQYGFYASSTLTGATNNYGFHSNLAAATGRWNFYSAGDAQNYFLGNTGIGGLPSGTYKLEVTGTAYVSSNMTVNGNLTVNGTTQTINSTVVTIDDPIFTLGGDTAPATNDSKDRGIEFRWHNGTVAKTGFFGFDRSTGKFTFIPDGTNSSEVYSGTKGTLDATIEWADILNKPATATTNSFGSVTTDNTDTEYTWTANGTATSLSAASNLKVVAGDGIQVHVDTTNNAVRITNDDTVDPTVFNENLTLSTNWQDTTINGADLSTGSYMVQITVNDSSVGGGQVNEIYTGMMSWYASDTNSTESDEVQLHRAGNGPGSGAIYLRIQRTATADANDLKLQIIGNTNNSGSATYTFKFRKLI